MLKQIYGKFKKKKQRKEIKISREEIEDATKEFLENGGKITYLESDKEE